ncbi:hypothetical protein BX265_0648 [Streptomyces sp. TLI_235]|nr:zinc finger Ran-binding domain-containing protein [Streptomyces sp. TLI_235]PBC75952.1 hypothetical protein BX265_0648 [Streptomyces sp. TLI_235]
MSSPYGEPAGRGGPTGPTGPARRPGEVRGIQPRPVSGAAPLGRPTPVSRPTPVGQRPGAGPDCPACRHENPAHRVRCEICGAELRPGRAGEPAPSPAPPPPAPVPEPGRRVGRVLLLVLLPVVVTGAVLALALLLG